MRAQCLTSWVDASFPFFRGEHCLRCQLRNYGAGPFLLSSSFRHYASGGTSGQTAELPASQRIQHGEKQTPIQASRPSGDKDDFVPPTLDRPIGLPYPPREGQNTGIDTRSFRQRRDDFVDYEKHILRRQELTKQVAKPYFREWTNMRYHQGKAFMSNQRLLKREKALYFPNLFGITLASPREKQNTTSLLRGKISVVSLFSSVWAEHQVITFTGPTQNPGLYEALQAGSSSSGSELAQKVDINLEENSIKAWLIRMFMWRMRRNSPAEQHKRYFLVRKGLSNGLKEAIGMMNSKVGYIYLLDDDCRIRWAGSGHAEEIEMQSLNNGVRKLVEEKKARLKAEELVSSKGSKLGSGTATASNSFDFTPSLSHD
ncbi:ATP10 domain containing protein [Elaphomyces granulatus]